MSFLTGTSEATLETITSRGRSNTARVCSQPVIERSRKLDPQLTALHNQTLGGVQCSAAAPMSLIVVVLSRVVRMQTTLSQSVYPCLLFVHLSVRLSVTLQRCVKTAKAIRRTVAPLFQFSQHFAQFSSTNKQAICLIRSYNNNTATTSGAAANKAASATMNILPSPIRSHHFLSP